MFIRQPLQNTFTSLYVSYFFKVFSHYLNTFVHSRKPITKTVLKGFFDWASDRITKNVQHLIVVV